VVFVEADPDRPVIVGVVPNPEIPSPVDLSNHTQNVLRTASFNEMVIEDLLGQERIRVHSPHHDTTLQLGAVEEPEEGAITATDANITEASMLSNNEATARKMLLCGTSSALMGDSAVVLAGIGGLLPAVDSGMQKLGAVNAQRSAMQKDLRRMAEPPGARSEDEDEDPPPNVEPQEGMRMGAGLWSDLTRDLAASAQDAAMKAVSVMARCTDDNLDQSIGRLQGEPMGEPLRPSVVLGSPITATLFGRERAMVFGDRVAALSSHDTASVVGNRVALLKSPGAVEIAGGKETKVTSAGDLDLSANTIRVVGGYYPAQEAPPLDEQTSVGVMARHEMRLVSIEDCILACAKKNVIATAHTGDMKLTAKKEIAIQGGSISCSGGHVAITSGKDILIKADGTITIQGAKIVLKGDVTVEDNLNAKKDVTVGGVLKAKNKCDL
jgi:uncharacterized protein (DUF2345 family)